jgi:hypothetical protein
MVLVKGHKAKQSFCFVLLLTKTVIIKKYTGTKCADIHFFPFYETEA